MRRIVSLLALAIPLAASSGCVNGSADPGVAWLGDHAVRMRSVDPADENFDDLKPLAATFAKARIVQLGEQSHGDGTTFDAKIRLIKFLHREMGFDVLAFESGLYDCRRAWQAFRAGEPPQTAAQQGIFGIWTRSKQLEPLFQYLSSQAVTARPLELAGFDCQFTARGSKRLMAELQERVLSGDPPRITAEQATALDTLLQGLIRQSVPVDAYDEGLHALTALEKSLVGAQPTATLSAGELAYWRQLLRSIRTNAALVRALQEGDAMDWKTFNLRDAQMAENLLWLTNQHYSDSKIIVWGATMHLLHDAATIDTRMRDLSYDQTVPMGHHVWKALGKDVYTLGFVAYEGTAGAAGRKAFPVEPAPAGSLEALCRQAGLENAVIDFRELPADSPLREPILSRPLGHSLMKARWPGVLDGVVFTRHMVPSTER